MKFATIIFGGAGAWGVLVLVPLYFACGMIGRQQPPPITHPEYYYGFLGVALVWQFAFFVIAGNPTRFRPMMLPAMAEKFVHVGTMMALYLQGRMNARQLAFNLPDLVLGLLFVAAFVKTRTGGRTRHVEASTQPVVR
jgi:hypothetical protein